jgi:hypothetical protein
MHAPGGDLHQEQHVNAGQPDRVDVQKSQARIPFVASFVGSGARCS